MAVSLIAWPSLQGELFLLVTDQGYLREVKVVWETLANVEGDGVLVDGEFHSAGAAQALPPSQPVVLANTQEQVDQEWVSSIAGW